MGPHGIGEDASKTLYHFGNNKYEEWSFLFDRYKKPRNDILQASLLWAHQEQIDLLMSLISSFKKTFSTTGEDLGKTTLTVLDDILKNEVNKMLSQVTNIRHEEDDEIVDAPEAAETEAGSMASRSRSASNDGTALSFGLGGSGSGVPFHTHGPVFAEVSHGQKVSFSLPFPHPRTFDRDLIDRLSD